MFDRDKFKALVHYICYRRSDRPSTLGAVKLNKILWLADFLAYRKAGESLTDARYVKRQFGPVPQQILTVVRELERDGKLTVREVPYHGKQKKEYISLQMSSVDFLSQQEREMVNQIIDFVCDEHTATSISKMSHDHIWKMAADGEEIPYYTIFASPGEITAEDREWARMQLEQAG